MDSKIETENSKIIPNGYKMTELGILPKEWEVVRLGEVFNIQQGKQVSQKNRIGNNQKYFLRTSNIFWGSIDTSKLDQMHFTLEEEKKYELKYGDLLVCEGGAIGRTAIWQNQIDNCYYQNHLHRLRAINNKVYSRFYLFWLWYAFEFSNIYLGQGNITTIPNLSSSRVSLLSIPLPPLSEQQAIASILSTVQKAIVTENQLIERTRELKKSMMHKLFTEGTRGEKQKMTEIGPIPESWEVGRLGDVVIETQQINLNKEKGKIIKYIDVSSIDREKLVIKNTQEYKIEDAPGRARKKVCSGDVIFATVRPTLLRVAYIDELYHDQVCSTAFCVLRAKGDNISRFLYYLVQRETFIKQLASIQSGANYPAVTDRQVKAQPVPLSPFPEQQEIAKILSTIDQKIEFHTNKKQKFEELFRTLLHELMTAKRRVN